MNKKLVYDTGSGLFLNNSDLVWFQYFLFIYRYGIVYQKGYLDSGPVVSVVTTKLKGAQILPGDSGEWRQNCPNGSFHDDLLDHTDLVVPPQVSFVIQI